MAAPLKPVSAFSTISDERVIEENLPRTKNPSTEIIRKQSKNGGHHERNCRRKDHVDRRACWYCITAGMLIADPADKNLSLSCCEGCLARPHRCAGDVRLREFAAGARSRSNGPARRVHSGGQQCALMPGSATRCLPRRDLQTCADSPRIVLPRLAARVRWKRDPSKYNRRLGNLGTNILRTDRVRADLRLRRLCHGQYCSV